MKLPNSYGSITKLSGNRRKPYMVRITTGMVTNEEKKTAYAQRAVLGYYETRKDAMIALAEYNNKPYNLDRRTITVNDVWNRIKDAVKVSENRKKVYKSNYDKYIADYIGTVPMRELKTEQIQEVFDDCEHGYSTKSNIRCVMNAIYEYSMKNDICDKDYMKYVTFEQESTILQRQIYTLEEVRNLWVHAGTDEYDFALILLYTGMRIKELRELRSENVNLTENTIKIVQGKNKYSERIIPIHSKIRPLIECRMNKEMLFRINKGHFEYFANNTLNHLAYDTRHTFASRMHECKAEKVVIQRLMGHKPETILEQTYTHLSMGELAENIEKLKY